MEGPLSFVSFYIYIYIYKDCPKFYKWPLEAFNSLGVVYLHKPCFSQANKKARKLPALFIQI